ncbi:hypothetical protein KAR91_50330 [Candidatus Pacearchaeota archaeon]|nr:hypothetical protein [Candidatus Pacearchaeota archaeon]
MSSISLLPEMFEGCSPEEKAEVLRAFAEVVEAANQPMGLPAGIALAVLCVCFAWMVTAICKDETGL